MKINTSEICIRYSKKISEDIAALHEDNKNFLETKAYLENTLIEYKDFINSFCTININNLEELNFSFVNRNLLQKKYETNSELNITEARVKRILNMFIEVKRNINKNVIKIEELNKLKIDSSLSIKVLSKFNTLIVDHMLTGYIFNLGYNLSFIRIKGRDVSLRKKKKIDWGKSNKTKKELLESGQIPYEVTERDEKGQILKDNGGVFWLSYHNKPIEYLWHWAKGRVPFPNKYFYKFKPTYCGAANNGCVQKLRQLEASGSDNLKYFN